LRSGCCSKLQKTREQEKAFLRTVEKKQAARFRGAQKDIPAYPTLEQLLWLVNGGKKCKVFVRPKFDGEGRCVKCFTAKGEKLYKRLTDFIGGAIRLAFYETKDDEIAEQIAEIVEAFDEIAQGNG